MPRGAIVPGGILEDFFTDPTHRPIRRP
jgi:hypothetical protein